MAEIFSSDFLMNLAGAVVNGMVDWSLEYYFFMNPTVAGTFPYIGLDPLPPADDLLAGIAIPGAQYIVGRYTKRETIKKLGQGGLSYGTGMVLHHTLSRAMPYTSQEFRGTTPLAVAVRTYARPPPVSPTPVIKDHIRYTITR